MIKNVSFLVHINKSIKVGFRLISVDESDQAMSCVLCCSEPCCPCGVAQMGYMRVEEHTPTLLRLRRSPGVRSWSLLVGESSLRRLPPEVPLTVTRFPLQLWCRSGWRRRTTAQVGGRGAGRAAGCAAARFLTAVCGFADSLLWKSFYVTGCLFVALQNMEEWEEAVFDKNKNQIELRNCSLYTLVLTLWKNGHERGQ